MPSKPNQNSREAKSSGTRPEGRIPDVAQGDAAFSRVVAAGSGRGRKAASPPPGDWKRIRFGDLFAPVKRKNIEGNENVLTISAQDGLVNQLEFYNHPYASEDTSGYTLLTKGEFAYNKSYSGDCPYGAIKRLERYDKGVVSPLYLCFSPKPGVNGDFFAHYFNGGMLNRALYRIAQEGARNHGLLNIPTEGFFDAELIVPSPPEQRRIAAILSACDRVIDGKQKLLDAKKTRKRALMQMLLEPNTWHHQKAKSLGKWQTIPFEKCFEPLRNNTYSRMCMTSDNGIANIHYGDVLIKYGELLDFFSDNIPSLISGTLPDGDFLKDGDIVIADTAEDETCGRTVEIANLGSRKAVAGLHTIACRPKPGLFVPGWLGYFMNSVSYHRQLVPLMAGIKVLSISRTALKGTTILVPPLFEQRRTVSVLSAVDRVTDLLAHEIDAWKEKRKALSQLLLSGKVRV